MPTENRDARDKRERAERYAAVTARIAATLTALRAAVVAAGHTWSEADRRVTIDGQDVRLYVEEGRSGGDVWSQHGTGKLRLTYGGYPLRSHHHPEPKAGYDVAKIAKALCEYAAMLADRRKATQAVADRLNAEAGREPHGSAAAKVGDNGQLLVEVRRVCTEDQARALLAAVKTIFGP